MNVFTNPRNEKVMEGAHPMLHGHRGPGRPIPPHERHALMRIEFDEADLELLNKVFGDEDTAQAAMQIIMDAPPEIQILGVQLMNIIKEVA